MQPPRTIAPSPLRTLAPRWFLYAVCFVLAGVFRYLLLERGFPNDHFVYITGGWQWLSGEWPTRDWVDGGAPLMLAASALSQALVGPTLAAEGMLVSLAFAAAAAVTAMVVFEWTGSLRLAATASLLEVAVVPRTYSYPKLLIYALAFLCFSKYVRRPTTVRLMLMASVVAAAFLFRHDHGAFVGAGALLTTALVGSGSPDLSQRRAVQLAIAVGVLLMPYLAWVQVYEGLLTHAGIGWGFGQREISTQWGVWPRIFGDPAPFSSALLYWYYAIPAAAAVLVLLSRDDDARRHRALVLPVAAVAILANLTFLRAPLPVRLPDPIVPAVLLGAWLVHRAMGVRSRRAWTLAAAAGSVGLFSASVLQAGDTMNALEQANLLREGPRLPQLVAEQTTRLGARLPEHVWPSRASASLVPFYRYVDRCTTEEHRVLVGGFLVEVPFFARRRFAGGQRYFGGSYGFDDAAERRALTRLDAQVVPFALIPTDYDASFAEAFPLLEERIRSRYELMADVPVTPEQRIRILVDGALTPTGRDLETGWPCFR